MISPSRLLLVPLALTVFLPISPAQAQKFGKVSVGGVSIAGLDRTAATRRLTRELAPKLNTRVTLTAGSKKVVRTRRQLGFSLDLGAALARAGKQNRVPIAFSVDQKTLSNSLDRLSKTLSSRSQEAVPVLVGKRVLIRRERPGILVNASQSAARVKAQAEKNAAQTRFALVVNRNAPQITAARLKGINAILGTFTTQFNPGNVKRTRNMRIAIGAINGTLLSPNETFSLNQIVGERTQARGYRTATIFEGGRKEPGIGGGVSQVTGTIFNAALVAGLPIETYQVHSRPVTYLPIGRDATVSWGNFDMKFKNDTGAPIYVSYKISGSRATATLFGKRTGRRASMRVVKKTNGPRDISAILYRTIRQNGKVVKKERVGSSRYNWKEDNED
ncbi:MAG TPA: VanW family protein [Abditibacterium sp.]|jgi:vancomycin resistance protein YoaR